MTIARIRKAAVAAVGLIAQAVALGLIPAKFDPIAQAILGLATAYGVYRVPNAESADGEHRAEDYASDVA